ncbi:esterase [Sneathiella chungangensis]|nr:esterase [Sneathiella chungangensis]
MINVTKFVGATMVMLALTGPAFADDAFNVKEIGSYHVGGREVHLEGLPVKMLKFTPDAKPLKSDPNGRFEVEQMYVQYVRLADPKAKYPLLMWHGGGMSGVTWETKPDGQLGWQSFFLKAGHDVYVSDAMERGRASWARYPEIYKTEPFFRTKAQAWTISRIGPTFEGRKEYDGQQFPTGSFDQLMKQAVPRWGSENNAPTQAAYDAYVQKQCPCVLMLHSQASSFGFKEALRHPDLIKAIIAVEPSGRIDASTDELAKMSGIPHLFIWGDYLKDVPIWGETLLPTLESYQDDLKKAGVPVTVWHLPEMGIKGNTHMMMMDRNSDVIAAKIQDWINDAGLMK